MAFFGCIGLIVVILAISAGMGALTMVALGAFGIHISFWAAWAVYIVLSAIFRGATK